MTKVSEVKGQLIKTCCVLSLAAFTAFLAGCRHGFEERVRPDLYTGSLYERGDTLHPIHVSKGQLAMGVKVRRNATKLLPYERNEVRTFLNYYRNQSSGQLTVRLPSNSPYQAAVNKVLYSIQH